VSTAAYRALALRRSGNDSDAHRLEEILSVNVFRLATLTIAELKLALQGQMNRSLVVQS
jgi:hypothetical protein